MIPPRPPTFPPPNNIPGFPWCRCDRNSFGVPYYLNDNVVVTENAKYTNYTFAIEEKGCTVGQDPCCNMDLWKIDFPTTDGCRASVSDVFLNTDQRRSPQFEYMPASENWLYKITNLGLNLDTAYGATVTLQLSKSGACPTLDTFLKQKSYAIFSKNNHCCPTYMNWPAIEMMA
eukprot:CAMPEP_0119104996 /NCGR_PEP_ID=MMETSP1180-20130426/3069_1 /TAXON_ID=3052 ORGANISM="Chlamydomonas cf sp, Strain CCMP681" /NCGR_SAMPLE_ID=MMETSP1180 /ASSEMBLY_ACC=CAM_ASM_000741 /LENGTH=173 /DNA_ID=CAMNT_0007089917 /DNA_START=59 /DNA_END=580 /DNA_ORIENTATION=+